MNSWPPSISVCDRLTFHSSAMSCCVAFASSNSMHMTRNLSLFSNNVTLCPGWRTTFMLALLPGASTPVLGRTRNFSGDVVLIWKWKRKIKKIGSVSIAAIRCLSLLPCTWWDISPHLLCRRCRAVRCPSFEMWLSHREIFSAWLQSWRKWKTKTRIIAMKLNRLMPRSRWHFGLRVSNLPFSLAALPLRVTCDSDIGESVGLKLAKWTCEESARKTESVNSWTGRTKKVIFR